MTLTAFIVRTYTHDRARLVETLNDPAKLQEAADFYKVSLPHAREYIRREIEAKSR